MRFRSKKQDALARDFCLSEVEEQIAHVYLDTVQNELLILPHHVSDVGAVRIPCTLQALTEALPQALAAGGNAPLSAETLYAFLGGDTWENAMRGKKLVNVSRKENLCWVCAMQPRRRGYTATERVTYLAADNAALCMFVYKTFRRLRAFGEK